MNKTLTNTSNGSPACSDHVSSNEPTSIHSALIDEVYDIPMKEISRPLLSELNEDKVQSLMETIRVKSSRLIDFIDDRFLLDDGFGSNSTD
jgi:hypothetical protein